MIRWNDTCGSLFMFRYRISGITEWIWNLWHFFFPTVFVFCFHISHTHKTNDEYIILEFFSVALCPSLAFSITLTLFLFVTNEIVSCLLLLQISAMLLGFSLWPLCTHFAFHINTYNLFEGAIWTEQQQQTNRNTNKLHNFTYITKFSLIRIHYYWIASIWLWTSCRKCLFFLLISFLFFFCYSAAATLCSIHRMDYQMFNHS